MSLRTIRSGATAMTEASFLQFLTDLLNLSGVFDVTGTQFKVTAGSGLAVNIAVGRAYLLQASGNGYPIINDASISNLAINSNGAGNPRYTSVVLYVDTTISPNSTSTNNVFVIAVDGTAAASPVPPSGSTIQSACGAGNPYTVLANVLVNAGASVPTAINDVRTQAGFRNDIFNQEKWVIYNPTAASTLTLDLAQGKKFQINMPAGNITLALLNVPLTCKTIQIRITQDTVGGRTVTWFGGISWGNGVVPTLTTAANKSDDFAIQFLTVTNDSSNTSEGSTVNQNV